MNYPRRLKLSPQKKRVLVFAFLFTLAAVLSSCARQPSPDAFSPPGFWFGLLHGFLIVFSFIGSLFSDSIRIYAFPNGGVWYDFGYLLGATAFLGGGGSTASS